MTKKNKKPKKINRKETPLVGPNRTELRPIGAIHACTAVAVRCQYKSVVYGGVRCYCRVLIRIKSPSSAPSRVTLKTIAYNQRRPGEKERPLINKPSLLSPRMPSEESFSKINNICKCPFAASDDQPHPHTPPRRPPLWPRARRSAAEKD